jgi:hypothetical protein
LEKEGCIENGVGPHLSLWSDGAGLWVEFTLLTRASVGVGHVMIALTRFEIAQVEQSNAWSQKVLRTELDACLGSATLAQVAFCISGALPFFLSVESNAEG